MSDTIADIILEIPRAVVCMGVPAGVVWVCWVVMGG